MALKAVLDSLDGVEDALKGFYTESDGKHVLDVEGIDLHPQIMPLKNAFERTKTDKATLAQKVKDTETQLAEALKGKPDEAAVMQLRQQLEAERDTLKAQVGDLTGRLTGVTRDRALADALAASGVTNPAFVKAATAMLSSQVRMDGDKAIIETDMGPLALADHVKRWAAGEGKDFVSAPSGGGAKGNNGTAQGRTITRAQFDAMPTKERQATLKGGAKIVDN